MFEIVIPRTFANMAAVMTQMASIPSPIITRDNVASYGLPVETIKFAHKLFHAAANGDIAFVLSVIDAGLPVNLTNAQGNTLLMQAAYANHTELVKELIKRGADPNRLNDRGQSIIAGAVFKRCDDVVNVLLENGADPRLGRPTAIEVAYTAGREQAMFDILGAREGDVPENPKVWDTLGY